MRRYPAFIVPGYTFFYWGFTIPKEHYPYYRSKFNFSDGNQTKKIQLKIGSKFFPARLRLVRIRSKRFGGRDVIQVTYENDLDTLKALRKALIYSYATTINKQKPKLKELVRFWHSGKDKFDVQIFAKQSTDFDDMLRSLEDRNLLEFWKSKRALKDSFVRHESKWLTAKELAKTTGVNAIYFLHHARDKQIYVGKANRLANRVKAGIGRVGMANDWNRCMFFEISPAYAHLLPKIENFAIRALSTVLRNDLKVVPIADRDIRLVNRHLRNRST